MSPIKEAAIAAIRGLPEDGNLERILEDIIYHAKIARGLEDVAAGRTFSLEEIIYRAKIEEGIRDADAGRVTQIEEVMAEFGVSI